MNGQLALYNGHRIAYCDEGQGSPVVLLHGFTESMEIWEDFMSVLAESNRVICIDLPGHGQSECVAEIHSMELMAEVVKKVLDILKVSRAALLGHSMGGYVALAFAEKYPEFLSGLCLFHSTATADTPEARTNRNRTIEFVKQHHSSFISTFIPELFAPASQDLFKEQISHLVASARRMTPEGIIAAQYGMRDRSDQTAVLRDTHYPVLFMLGKLDNRIPYESTLKQVALPEDAVLLSLGGVAHMGYIEARDKTLYALRVFLEGL